MSVPLLDLKAQYAAIRDDVERAMREVVESQVFINGPQVAACEQAVARYCGAARAVGVSSGTDALLISMMAEGIGPGDEVITTPYTFIATASAALQQGAVPVFVDIDLNSYNLDPTQIEAAITPATKAIVPVHLAGRPADMDAIMEVARRHDLRVLEDACQAWGAAWRGRRVGAIGDLGCFSFQSSKNVSAGEGGIVITNDEALAELCWSLHNVGRVRDGAWYQHEIIGGNLRMTEWQAAVLLAQLERLTEHAARREANARYLAEALSEVPGVTPLPWDDRITGHAHHLFICRYDPAAFGGRSRADFVAALVAEGITTASVGYATPLHRNNAIRRSVAANLARVGRKPPLAADGLPALPACPRAEWATQHTFWLAQNTLLGTQADMDSIVAAICKIRRAWG